MSTTTATNMSATTANHMPATTANNIPETTTNNMPATTANNMPVPAPTNTVNPLPDTPTTAAARPATYGQGGSELDLHQKTETAAAQLKNAQKAEKAYNERKQCMNARKDWYDCKEHFAVGLNGFKMGGKCVGRIIKAGPVLLKEHSVVVKDGLAKKRQDGKAEVRNAHGTARESEVRPSVPTKDKKKSKKEAKKEAKREAALGEKAVGDRSVEATRQARKNQTLDQVRERLLNRTSRFHEEEEEDVLAPREDPGRGSQSSGAVGTVGGLNLDTSTATNAHVAEGNRPGTSPGDIGPRASGANGDGEHAAISDAGVRKRGSGLGGLRDRWPRVRGGNAAVVAAAGDANPGREEGVVAEEGVVDGEVKRKGKRREREGMQKKRAAVEKGVDGLVAIPAGVLAKRKAEKAKQAESAGGAEGGVVENKEKKRRTRKQKPVVKKEENVNGGVVEPEKKKGGMKQKKDAVKKGVNELVAIPKGKLAQRKAAKAGKAEEAQKAKRRETAVTDESGVLEPVDPVEPKGGMQKRKEAVKRGVNDLIAIPRSKLAERKEKKAATATDGENVNGEKKTAKGKCEGRGAVLREYIENVLLWLSNLMVGATTKVKDIAKEVLFAEESEAKQAKKEAKQAKKAKKAAAKEE